MEKYKKLINNSIIFVIGSFGSRLINILMVPLYTRVLNTSEFGIVDLINVTISLLLPFITFELGKASLRFAVEAKDFQEQNKIFSNLIAFNIIVSILLVLFSPVFLMFHFFENYIFLFLVLLILKMFNDIYSQYIRGINLIKEFALNGILMSITTVLSNIILLLVFDFGVEGYIISMIIATFASNIYLFVVSKGLKRIRSFNTDLKLLKNMMKFSLPIIPSAAIWWIINGSTRYFVLYFVGASANGLFAVASKIPSIISLVTNVFSQAWQLSSYEEYDSEDKEVFYSNIYEMYFTIMFFMASLIIVFVKPILSILASPEYFLSWRIVPFLLVGVIYQSLSGFYGIIYQASKKTKGSLVTSVYGGVTSVIMSFLLVPLYGALGASISTAISFFVTFILRVWDTRKIISVNIKWTENILTNIIFIIQIIFVLSFPDKNLYLIQLILWICIIIVNRKTFSKLYTFVKSIIFR